MTIKNLSLSVPQSSFVSALAIVCAAGLLGLPPTVWADSANITQIKFTTSPQTIDNDTSSGTLTIQTQNVANTLEKISGGPQTINLSSSSGTGQFSASSTNWVSVATLTMNSGTANRNFFYRDVTASTHTLTVTAQGQGWTAATQSITISAPPDTLAPVITLLGSNPVNLTVGDPYSDDGATATDTVDGDLGANIVVGGNTVDSSIIGAYVITYNVSDNAGNAALQVTRTVNVSAAPAPPLPPSRVSRQSGDFQRISQVGEVLGAFTEAERQARIATVRFQLIAVIKQLVSMLEAKLAITIR